MKTIFKYEITPTSGITVPAGAKILSAVGNKDSGQLFVYALVDTGIEEKVTKHFIVLGTGHDASSLPDTAKFLNTVTVGNGTLVFHVFEVLKSNREFK